MSEEVTPEWQCDCHRLGVAPAQRCGRCTVAVDHFDEVPIRSSVIYERQVPQRSAWASVRTATAIVKGAPADAVKDCEALYDESEEK